MSEPMSEEYINEIKRRTHESNNVFIMLAIQSFLDEIDRLKVYEKQATRICTHSEACWQWHPECARRIVIKQRHKLTLADTVIKIVEKSLAIWVYCPFCGVAMLHNRHPENSCSMLASLRAYRQTGESISNGK